MSKYPYISQVDQRDCGVAALAMILKHYGSSYSLAYLRELAQTSREGTSALGLVEAGKQLGLETQAIRADLDLFKQENLSYPFIVHVVKEGELQHYYTVFGQTKGQLIIGDPDPSKKVIKMPLEVFEKEWTGVALFFVPGKTYIKFKEEVPGLLSFLPILFRRKGLITVVVLLSFLVTLVNIIGSYYLQSIIDHLIPQEAYSLLTVISLGLCISYLAQQVFTFFKDYLLHRLGNYLSISVILPYIKHVLSLPISFFSSRRTGEITSRFGDANTIIDALASTILSIFLDVTIVITLAVALILQNRSLFLMTLTVVPLYVLIILAFYKLFEKKNYQLMEANSQVNTAVIDDLRGIETLKSLRVEERRYQEIEVKFHDYLKKSLSKDKWQLIQDALKTGVQLVSNVFILWYGAQLVMEGQLSAGQLITYNMLLNYFTTPLINIINLQSKIQQAKVANNRLQEVYVVNKEEKGQLKDLSFKQLDLKGVSHRFSYQQETLHNINLTINKGEKIALMGQSGSGKTTLAKILSGYYTKSSGHVGLDKDPVSHAELRQLVTYVPQQTYVFTGTILDNLLLGLEGEVDEQLILKVCEQADILADIQKMPLGFQTQVSEDGGLSGGQKQRLAIARALLSKQPILIFDEATSGLDRETESRVMANLAKLKRTMIFIAHRSSVHQYVSRVVTMADGRLEADSPNFNPFQFI
ncbi:peptide cleavage/export ABC transporter [uncultured Streptococcus sp.]|uniref:peptide cleavage/export ABC transporter n=1 Tax=uncultured Streptococcus sp. TaxID=83427 RepID=UPI0028DD090D|nr:peptide cleavage/export ABC transporter [uncultured Streptococcus sp.]